MIVTTRFALGLALLAALLVTGCVGDNGADRSADQGSATLEDEYTASVENMQSTLAWYDDESDPAAVIGQYRQRMNDDLENLESIQSRMQSQCGDFSECPGSGGATGRMMDGCMRGGHMMDQGEMDRMRQDREDCRAELDRYFGMCGDRFDPNACTKATLDHVDRMGSILDNMASHCRDWWSGNGGDCNGCDHWGDCNGDHNGGHMGGMM